MLKDGKLTKLEEKEISSDPEYDVLYSDEWIGALYYNILTVNDGTSTYYVLFGFNGYSKYNNLKVADVLTFEGDKPIFGAEIFVQSSENGRANKQTRLMLDYSGDSNVSLNYNPGLDMITHDHLIQRIGRIPGQGPTLLPDGSYVGWKWAGDHFEYVEKIYHQVLDEAPRPQPILDQRKNTIDGK